MYKRSLIQVKIQLMISTFVIHWPKMTVFLLHILVFYSSKLVFLNFSIFYFGINTINQPTIIMCTVLQYCTIL